MNWPMWGLPSIGLRSPLGRFLPRLARFSFGRGGPLFAFWVLKGDTQETPREISALIKNIKQIRNRSISRGLDGAG
jgi:hypothetical protein